MAKLRNYHCDGVTRTTKQQQPEGKQSNNSKLMAKTKI